MEFDAVSAFWVAVIVLIAMAFWRVLAGLMAASDNTSVSKIGTGLGAIVG